MKHFRENIIICAALFSFFFLVQKNSYAQKISSDAASKPLCIVDSIAIITQDVFDSTGQDLPILGPILNKIHIVTKEQTIGYRLAFSQGDTLTQKMIDETENNLRQLGILADISITYKITNGVKELSGAVVQVITRDSWSTQTGFGFDVGGNNETYRLSLREVNLLGLGKELSLNTDYTTVNEKGFGSGVSYRDPNLFGSQNRFDAKFYKNRFENVVDASLGQPFYTDKTEYSYKVSGSYFSGNNFFYFPPSGLNPNDSNNSRTKIISIPATFAGAVAYFANSRQATDLFRSAVSLIYRRSTRDSSWSPWYPFENSVQIFGGISSTKRKFVRIANVENFGNSLVQVGGFGQVNLGKTIPHSGGLDNGLYIGAGASQAFYSNKLYSFLSAEAGTSLSGKQTKMTIARTSVRTLYSMNDYNSLVFAFNSSNVWNWDKYLVQRLDNAKGLRGYKLYSLVGDNKINMSFEHRFFPELRFLFFTFGTVAFYDLGSVWVQGTKLQDTRWHSSAGVGLRLTNLSSPMGLSVVRVELPYNFDTKNFGQIIFSTEQPFDLFGKLDFQPPAPFLVN